jgi:WD repeat-containing protein 68
MSRIVTASVDTTCTVWDIEAGAAVTQLIAHDRAVYDVAWLPGSTDIFVSVGADGSLRAFDLRSLEHSTILYETPVPKGAAPGAKGTSPLLRICFHPTDSNYMATFHMDGHDVQVLDMRSPGQPVLELRAHRAQVNAAAFSSGEQPLLATAGMSQPLLYRPLVMLTYLYRGRLSSAPMGSRAVHFRQGAAAGEHAPRKLAAP